MHLSVSLALLFLNLSLAVQGQTFQYSRGWTNGKRRVFAQSPEVPAASASFMPAEDAEVPHPLSLFDNDELLDLVSQDVRLRRRLKRLMRRIEGINSRRLSSPSNNDEDVKDEDEASCECSLQSTVETRGRR